MKMQAMRVIALLGLFVSTLSAQHLPWSPSLEKAMERAREENRPVMICMHWDQEVACRQMLSKLYRDPEVIAAMKEFVLVGTSPDLHDEIEVEIDGEKKKVSKLFGGVDCETLIQCERDVKGDFFSSPKVTVPQHIFVSPKGEIILQKTYLLAKKPFIDLMQEAMILFTDEAVGGLESRAQAFFKALKKGKAAERKKAVRSVLEMHDTRVHELLFHAIQGLKRDKDREFCIRAMGYDELDSAEPLLQRWLSSDNTRIANCAVVSLEEVKGTSSAEELLALYDRTKNAELKKDILRALGPCGQGNAKAKALLLKQLKSRKEEMRRACYLSLGYHMGDDGSDVAAALEKAWKKEGRRFLQKASILIGFARGNISAQAETVRRLIKKEKNHQLKQLGAAIAKDLGAGDDASGNTGPMADIRAGDKFKRNG